MFAAVLHVPVYAMDPRRVRHQASLRSGKCHVIRMVDSRTWVVRFPDGLCGITNPDTVTHW